MAVKIMIESDDDRQVEITLEQYDDREWEEVCYEMGCSLSRQLAIRWLGDIEEGLFCAWDENGHSLGLDHFGPPPIAVMNPVYTGIRHSPFPSDQTGLDTLWAS